MKLSFILLSMFSLLIGSWQISSPPATITWANLADVKYRKKFYIEAGAYFSYPTFGNTIKSYEGKIVSIVGYVIPVDTEGEIYVVSKFPMAQCFFCGSAGPETIMMLNFQKKPKRMRTDEKRCFTGRLRLNSENIEELNFILDQVVLCE